MTNEELADLLIDPITGKDTRCTDYLGPGRYSISEVGGASDDEQLVTANAVVAAVYGWAAHTVATYKPLPDPVDEAVAKSIIAGEWQRVIEQLDARECLAGLEIWDLMGNIAVNVE